MSTLLESLQARFGDRLSEASEPLGETTIIVARETVRDVLRSLRDDPELAFDMLADLTAVDYLGREARFDVVMNLFSTAKKHRLRVKVPVPEEGAWAHTASDIWPSANWLEREVWDMFGIRFEGHPDLRRILMYPEFEGFPLRKDYPVMRRQPLIPERDPVENPWPQRASFGDKR